jgi:hypothetical protein
MEYPICLGGEEVGRSTVEREGLYYGIRCRLKLTGKVLCKILVSCGGREADLGIPVPEGSWFLLEKRIPVKRLGEGTMEFRVVPRHKDLWGRFIPLSPEEPFRYLARLRDARFEVRNGISGIVLADPADSMDHENP